MDLRQLRYFVTIARAGSFTAASRLLHVSQPALGYQIKQLEKALKVELLNRHARGVTLTDAGAKLLEHAEDLLSRLRRAEQAMAPFQKGLAGELALGVTPTSGRALVPALLAACAEKTALRVTVHQGMTGDLLRRVDAGALDLAFCYGSPGIDRVRGAPLYREPLCLVGPPDILGSRDPVSFDELSRFSLVLDDRFHVMRRLIERIARTRHVALGVALEIEPINLKREMMVRHRCCTIVPYGLFLDEIREGRLGARRIVDPSLMQALHLVARRGLNQRLSAFMLALMRDLVTRVIAEGELGWIAPRPGGKPAHSARRALAASRDRGQ